MLIISRTGRVLMLCLFIAMFAMAQTSKEALAVIHNVESAMGGIQNYDNTPFLKWDFGKRTLYWNKWTGDVRIENPEEALVILVNINTIEGKAFKNGNLVNNTNETKQLLQKGKNWWINDSYWLVMPWKLRDPGVSVTIVKTEILENGNEAAVLQLTFNNVGVTPDNKYHVYVDKTDNLIKQWAFYKKFDDAEPKFILPWDNYQNVGLIKLSFNRSKFGPKNVEAGENFNQKLFLDISY